MVTGLVLFMIPRTFRIGAVARGNIPSGQITKAEADERFTTERHEN
jgi:hypothetical protein